MDKGLVGNEKIIEKIVALKENFTEENLAVLLTVIRKRMLEEGQFVVMVDALGDGANMSLKTANYNGMKWFVAFTDFDQELKGKNGVMSGFMADIKSLFEMALQSGEVCGVILNPYEGMLTLDKALIQAILGE